MSVKPIAHLHPLQTAPAKPATAGLKTGTDTFYELLESAAHSGNKLQAADADAFAQMVRLEQLRTVMDPFNIQQEQSPLLSSPVGSPSNLLKEFKKQLPAGDKLPTSADSSSMTAVIPLEEPPAPPAKTTPSRIPVDLESIIVKASEQYGVPDGLIRAVIKAESNFNPNAVSRAGAQGLMQLMPATARGLGVTNSFDPAQNIMAGTRFLKDLLDRYHGNIDSALAAYNWGPGNVDRRARALPAETRDYISKVKSYYSQNA